MAIPLLFSCGNKTSKQDDSAKNTVPNIIFETDMGNDVDDALALDMVYKYVDEKRSIYWPCLQIKKANIRPDTLT